MSANKKPVGPFEFGIMDLSRFIDKSPATIRKYEADGHFVFPRSPNNDRVFNSKDIREITTKLFSMGRISLERRYFVEALMTLIEIMEEMNGQNRSNRP